jgi:isopenicillin N synthase-like dioxygenase
LERETKTEIHASLRLRRRETHHRGLAASTRKALAKKMTWKSQLLISEQYNERTANCEEYNTKRRHGSCNCSSMSSLMKELLIVSSIILISWHESRN